MATNGVFSSEVFTHPPRAELICVHSRTETYFYDRKYGVPVGEFVNQVEMWHAVFCDEVREKFAQHFVVSIVLSGQRDHVTQGTVAQPVHFFAFVPRTETVWSQAEFEHGASTDSDLATALRGRKRLTATEIRLREENREHNDLVDAVRYAMGHEGGDDL